MTALVFFDGLWHVNGFAASSKMDDKLLKLENKKIEDKKHHRENLEYSHNAILKFNKKKPIAFFKNFEEFVLFWEGAFPDTQGIDEFFQKNPLKNEYDLILFSHEDLGSITLPDLARLLKVPGNKLYSAEDSIQYGVGLLTGDYSAPLELLEYIIDNNYIPDVAMNSLHGEKHGKQLLQNNKWFIVRFFQPDLFCKDLIETLPFDYDTLN
jgi:hypothetical protein